MAIEKVADGEHGAVDPSGVGDVPVLVERDIKVAADQHVLALHIHVFYAFFMEIIHYRHILYGNLKRKSPGFSLQHRHGRISRPIHYIEKGGKFQEKTGFLSNYPVAGGLFPSIFPQPSRAGQRRISPLTQGFIHADGDGIGQVQAAGFFEHGDAHARGPGGGSAGLRAGRRFLFQKINSSRPGRRFRNGRGGLW